MRVHGLGDRYNGDLHALRGERFGARQHAHNQRSDKS
jgi:hypothetical protein